MYTKSTVQNTEKRNKHFWLYVLELEHGKYYVGQTSQNPDFRIKQHANGFYTAQWVRKHKFITTRDKIDLGYVSKVFADDEENKLTFKLMKELGFQNVRGGNYNYSGSYVKFFGRLFPAEDFKTALGIIFMMFVIAYLGLSKV